MPLVPLINGQFTVGNTTYNFTPDRFEELWDGIVAPLLNSLQSGASSPSLDLSLTGPGRVVGPEFLDDDPTKPTTDGTRTFTFPAGATVLAADENGVAHKITFTTPFATEELAPGQTDVYPHYRANQSEDSDDWTIEWHPQAPGNAPSQALIDAGYPCIGRVSVGADSITEYTPGIGGKESLVFTNALFQAKFAGIATGGSGDGGGAVDLSDYATRDYVNSLVADLQARLNELAEGPEAFGQNLDGIMNLVSALAAELSKVNPSSVEAYEAAIVTSEAGHSQNSTPDYTLDTNDPNEIYFDVAQGRLGA